MYFPDLITTHGHITVQVKPFADMNRQDLDSIIDIFHQLCWGCEFGALFLHQHNVNLTVESYEVKDPFKPDLSISDLLFHMHFFQATCRKCKNYSDSPLLTYTLYRSGAFPVHWQGSEKLS